MPDITMCKGDGCQKKEECYRYKAKPSEWRQSYFLNSPIKDGECEHFAKLYSAEDGDNER